MLSLRFILLLALTLGLACAAQPVVTISVSQGGQPVAEGAVISGTVQATVTVTDGVGLHTQFYNNFLIIPFNEPGHAPDTAVWSRTVTVDTRGCFDGENLFSVHLHPHNHPGEAYTTAFDVALFKVITANGNPAPNGDRLLPTVSFDTFGWTPTMVEGIGHVLSGGANLVDDSGTIGVDRSSNEAAPVQMIAHLGESVLGRFRWNNLTPPFGDSELVQSCCLRPFQTASAYDARVVVFAADGAGRANYGFKTIRMPALDSQVTEIIPDPILDAKILGIGQGSTLRVPDGGTTPVWVEIKNLRPTYQLFPEMTTWIGNRAVHVTRLAPLVQDLAPGVDSLIVEVPLPAIEVAKFLAARQGGTNPTAAPIWVDFNNGFVPCLPSSSHIHLASIRTTSYPWPTTEPTVVIRAPWTGSSHWIGTNLQARYDRWGNLPVGHRVQWKLDGGAWADDDGDGLVGLTGLSRGSHQFTIRLVTNGGTAIGSEISSAFTVANAAPQALADARETEMDTLLSIPTPGVLANDSDLEGDALTASLVTTPLHGTATMMANGSFTYRPETGRVGFDRFTYRIDDGRGGQSVAEVRIGVRSTSSGASLTGDWPMLGRDPQHSARFPGIIGDRSPTLAWTYAFPGGNGVNRLRGVAVSGNLAAISIDYYAYNPIRVVGLDSTTGVLAWERQFNSGDISAPSIGYGKVFVQRANHLNDSQVMALTLSNGSTAWSNPYSDQWGAACGAVVADGGVWIEGGATGGLLGYDANTGASRFSMTTLPFWTNWAPAWFGGKVYTWLQGRVREHDPLTGAVGRSKLLDFAGLSASNSGLQTMPLITGGDLILRSDDGRQLIAAGVADLRARWRVESDTFSGWGLSPAVADGVVYAPDSNGLSLVDQATGAKLGRVNIGMGPAWGPIITDDAIVVGHPSVYYSGPGTTLIIDRATLATRMTIPFAGPMALANGRLYIADGQTNSSSPSVRAYAFTGLASGLNYRPVAENGSATVVEDGMLDMAVVASDPEGDALTFTISVPPTHGTATIDSVGILHYRPSTNYAGFDSLSVAASDAIGSGRTGVISITVTAVNDAPVATDPTCLTTPGFSVAAGFSVVDVDGPSLSYSILTNPSNGQLSGVAPNLTYTPQPGFAGVDAFSVRVSDGSLSDVATVSVRVNRPPVATPQFVTVVYDTATAISPSGSDADGQSLTYRVVTQPTRGILSGEAPALIYTPHLGEVGSDSLVYVANDGYHDSAPATIGISIVIANPWSEANLPAAATPGMCAYQPTVSGFDMSGAGNAPDGGRFTWTSLPRDGIIEARVSALPGARGGLMLRSSLATNAAVVALLATSGGRLELLQRPSGGTTTTVDLGSIAPTHWVRLSRTATGVEAATSLDGTIWTTSSAVSISLPADLLGGLWCGSTNTVLANFAADQVRTSHSRSRMWPTSGGSPNRSGRLPGSFVGAPFAPTWQAELSGNLNPVAVGNGLIYVTKLVSFGRGWVKAYAADTGTLVWTRYLADAYSNNPPAFADGRVFVQRGNHSSDSQLWCLSAATGGVLWKSAFTAQWEHYLAPCPADGSVFINGGAHGGMYGYDQVSGSQRFFTSLPQYDGWSPAYADGTVYSWVAGVVRAHQPLTGVVLWSVDCGWNWAGWSMNSTPVVAEGCVVARGNNALHAIDTSTRTQRWTVSTADYSGTPAVAGGTVFAFAGDVLEARSLTDGTLLRSYASGQYLLDQPIVTDDVVIISSDTTTWILDRATFTVRQSLAAGGHPVLVDRTLYLASSTGTLRAFTAPPSQAPDSQAPVITSTAPTSVIAGTGYAYDVNATGTPAPTYALSAAPPGMTINPGTGMITWTPSSTGSASVTVIASNGTSPNATQSWTITVTASQVPVPGLIAEFFDFTASLSAIPDFSSRTPDVTRSDALINYASTGTAWTGLPASMVDTFASRHSGLLKIDTAGTYTLYVSSDDGSRVYLDGALVIDNDGLHGMRERSVTVNLAAGYHPLRVEFFENSGGAGLVFSWAGPGIAKQVVPASALWKSGGGTPANATPTISVLSAQTISEDGTTGALAFTVGDVETPPGTLVVTATSSNTVLVPATGIVLGGSGPNRSVTLIPAQNQNGMANIIVTVSDGTNLASRTVSLTVNAVNDPPVNTTFPSISGTVQVGQTLFVATGTWNDAADVGSIASYAYQWQRANDGVGTDLADIPGATTPNYVLAAADQGRFLRVRVTAIDAGTPAPGASASAMTTYTSAVAASSSFSATATANVLDGTAPLVVQFTGAATGGSGTGVAVDTTNDGLGSITAQGENGTGEGKLKAFDNSSGSKWLDFANANPTTRASWIQYRYPGTTTRRVSRYTITSANDAPQRDPADWALQGSNDGGANWSTLDVRTGQTFSARFQQQSFAVAAPVAYNAYRLRIDRVMSATANSVQLSEIELLEVPPAYTYQWTFGDGQTASGPNPQHTFGTPGIYQVVLTVTDGNANTTTATVVIEVLPSGAG